MESTFVKTLLIFATSNLRTNSSHSSPLPTLKSAIINFNNWKTHYSLLPAKLLGIFACTLQMHAEKKINMNMVNGEESQGQEKKADEFPQIFIFVCVQ